MGTEGPCLRLVKIIIEEILFLDGHFGFVYLRRPDVRG